MARYEYPSKSSRVIKGVFCYLEVGRCLGYEPRKIVVKPSDTLILNWTAGKVKVLPMALRHTVYF